MRAQDDSTPKIDRALLGTWARGTLGTLPIDDRAASIRFRLSPSLTPGEALVLQPLDGPASVERALEQLEARLEDLELPEVVKLRLDVLDGAGEPIAGFGKSKVFREPPSMVQTQTSAQGRTYIDVEPMGVELTRPLSGAFNLAAQLGGDSQVTLPTSTLLGILFWERLMDLRERERQGSLIVSLLSENRHMGELIIKGQVGLMDHTETMTALALDSLPRAARAEADVELARLSAQGSEQPETPAIMQAVQLLQGAGGLMEQHARARAMLKSGEPRLAQKVPPSSPTSQAAPAPAAAAAPCEPPAPAPAPAPAADPSALLGMLLGPSMQADVAATMLRSMAGPNHQAQLEHIARALLQTASQEPS